MQPNPILMVRQPRTFCSVSWHLKQSDLETESKRHCKEVTKIRAGNIGRVYTWLRFVEALDLVGWIGLAGHWLLALCWRLQRAMIVERAYEMMHSWGELTAAHIFPFKLLRGRNEGSWGRSKGWVHHRICPRICCAIQCIYPKGRILSQFWVRLWFAFAFELHMQNSDTILEFRLGLEPIVFPSYRTTYSVGPNPVVPSERDFQ